jgi:putative membrane protein
MMSWFLILISIFLISKEKESKIWALIIFILAGFLGIATLNSPMEQPLLPLLTGLFGSSTLLYSISKKIIIPEQKISTFILSKRELIKPTLATALVSPICSFLPGLGSSQAAIIGSEITGEISQKQFLILMGSINTLVMSISFVTLFLTNKTRTGAANAISQIAQISSTDLIILLITISISAAISFLTASIISKFFAKHIHKFNYTLISTLILVFLTSIISIISGPLGMFTLVVSTLLGLTCIYAGVRRGFLMGALLIPTILFYLPF